MNIGLYDNLKAPVVEKLLEMPKVEEEVKVVDDVKEEPASGNEMDAEELNMEIKKSY